MTPPLSRDLCQLTYTTWWQIQVSIHQSALKHGVDMQHNATQINIEIKKVQSNHGQNTDTHAIYKDQPKSLIAVTAAASVATSDAAKYLWNCM